MVESIIKDNGVVLVFELDDEKDILQRQFGILFILNDELRRVKVSHVKPVEEGLVVVETVLDKFAELVGHESGIGFEENNGLSFVLAHCGEFLLVDVDQLFNPFIL